MSTDETKADAGNGDPPYRDGDNRVHGPGGPVFMGKGAPCTDKLDHGLRPGVWFAVDNIVPGKLFRGVPVFEFEKAWWSWRSEQVQPKLLLRTSVVTGADQLQAGQPVVFFVEDGAHRFLDNEYDMLTSSRWLAGVVDALGADSVRIKGWDAVPLETVRLIVEQKQL